MVSLADSKVGRILLESERAARVANERAAGIAGEKLRSAFAFSKAHVLTAWHCVRDIEQTDELWFRIRNAGKTVGHFYQYIPVKVLSQDEDFDVSVLVLDRARLDQIGLSEDEAEAVLAGSAILLGVDLSVYQQVRVKGFPANAPSADSDTLPARVIDLALPLGKVTALKLVGKASRPWTLLTLGGCQGGRY